ncbi:hypothetical protein BP6252_00782 [Coleophoma cylindrospora]|uniref:Phospholipid-transporting ATPase n=1 Tax=Coleophoma cylindrospora TaxID=1849047 RepID=A0A3D8SR05_9HELO|nr:hypothetical protein BP6252_00782 [Coleophoma cylindrospora]
MPMNRIKPGILSPYETSALNRLLHSPTTPYDLHIPDAATTRTIADPDGNSAMTSRVQALSGQGAGGPGSSQQPTARNRGYSLRRTLFAKGIHTRNEQVAGIELADAPLPPIAPLATLANPQTQAQAVVDGEKGRRPKSAEAEFSDSNDDEEDDPADDEISTRGKYMEKAQELYDKASRRIKFWEKEIPPSIDGRHVALDASRTEPLIDERTGQEFIDNNIRSCRYGLWDFIPRQLIFQFSKLANFYFLVISIMSLVPGLSTTGASTNLGPLLAFVAVSMAKEGYDDYRRYRLDEIENTKNASVLIDEESARKRNGKISVVNRLIMRWDAFLKVLLVKDPADREVGFEIEDIPTTSFGPWAKVKWSCVEVGDIVRLERDEPVPADIVLLHSDGPNGIAFVDTMDLDGETNLKSKQAPKPLAERCRTLEDLQTCRAQVIVEDPNPNLHNFDGRFFISEETLPLSINEVVFRGSTLRNTSTVFGLVINTGEECKIRMNANKTPRIKSPEIQKITNTIVVMLIFFVLLLTAFCTVAYQFWTASTEVKSWYLANAHVKVVFTFFGFIVLLNTLIPLSLYVSLEIIKIGQLWIMGDVEMYDEETNTPMEAHTSTILENLGQIDYCFTDKTGTLTENIMRFRKLSIAGTAWLHDFDILHESKAASGIPPKSAQGSTKCKGKDVRRSMDLLSPTVSKSDANATRPATLRRTSTTSLWKSSARPTTSMPDFRTEELIRYMRSNPRSAFTKKAKFFLLALALCHTCLPETQSDGTITFQAASPDELALVRAAQELGYLVIDRSVDTIRLKFTDASDCPEAPDEEYRVLDVIEFSSKRKRMSIVVRFPDGSICIFCKGADSAIMPRLKLAGLAGKKAAEVHRRASQRKSMEADEAMRRMSEDHPRVSFSVGGPSTGRKSMSQGRPSISQGRPSISNGRLQPIRDELDGWLKRREHDVEMSVDDMSAHQSPTTPRASMGRPSFASVGPRPSFQNERFRIDDSAVQDESVVFERCFQHIDEFATEGLRTLLYGFRFIDEEEYSAWRAIYMKAITSLVDRQQLIEDAGELIEQKLDLAGATAIEDKLQNGVPETIDKLRRANIKIWMLTGDKRETAINIAHSARICKNYSHLIVLDHTKSSIREQLTSALGDLVKTEIAHSVVVVDGQTLTEIEKRKTVAKLFFELAVIADSVICCRASPSQKAILVRKVRTKVKKSVTMAIGDGANDIAMIQEAHVGVGISGKEGLQAARTSDYAIAQFRFLQRLLFVHGHWNYVRTCKYVLGTFWKELLFYIVQSMYQLWNGYTGTSLYDPTSIAVFNTLFTSLCVIFLGVFEKDLEAATLIAVPELYSAGQRNASLSYRLYFGWMFMSSSEAILIYLLTHYLYGLSPLVPDKGLYPIGDLAFTATVVVINTKLLILEMHTKTIIPAIGWAVTVFGWFAWNLLLMAIHKSISQGYFISGGFVHHFGNTLLWWVVLLIDVVVVIVFELVVSAIRRVYFPTETDIFQELQSDPIIMRRFEETAQGLDAEMDSDKKSNEEQIRREDEVEKLLQRPRIMIDTGDSGSLHRRRPSADVTSPKNRSSISEAAMVEV